MIGLTGVVVREREEVRNDAATRVEVGRVRRIRERDDRSDVHMALLAGSVLVGGAIFALGVGEAVLAFGVGTRGAALTVVMFQALRVLTTMVGFASALPLTAGIRGPAHPHDAELARLRRPGRRGGLGARRVRHLRRLGRLRPGWIGNAVRLPRRRRCVHRLRLTTWCASTFPR